MVAIFQESGISPVVMHLLKNLDNHSDTMQSAIFKNLDGISLGELQGVHKVLHTLKIFISQKPHKVEILHFRQWIILP